MKWTKCKENLPDKDGLYLITHLRGGRWEMFFKTEDKKWYWQPNPYSVCGDGFIDQWLDETETDSGEIETLKAENSKMRNALEEIAKYKQISDGWSAKIATEALKTP